MQRMSGRKGARGPAAGQHPRARRLGEFDPLVPIRPASGRTAGENEGRLCAAQQFRRGLERVLGRAGRRRRREPGNVLQFGPGLKARFLHRRIEVDVDRPAGGRHGDLGAAPDRFDRRRRRARLVIPLGVVADQCALVGRGVNPVDIGPADGRVDRPGRAENDHGQSVAPGVEDAHGRVHQPDVRVDDDRQWPLRDPGIAVGNGDRMLLVQHQRHFRRGVAEEIHDRVVQSAVAGAGVQAHVGESLLAQGRRDQVAPEDRLVEQRWVHTRRAIPVQWAPSPIIEHDHNAPARPRRVRCRARRGGRLQRHEPCILCIPVRC